MAEQIKTSDADYLPFYVNIPEDERMYLLDRAGIKEKDEQILFHRLSAFAEENNNPVIKPEPFFQNLMIWAEKNNYVRYRHLQNARRMLIQLAVKMQEKKFCQLTLNDQEIRRILLTDPERTTLEALFANVKHNATTFFPTESDLPFGLSQQNTKEISPAEYNVSKVDECLKADKILKIRFAGEEGHILVPPSELPGLNSILLAKLRHFFFPGMKTKLLDDIARDLKAIMPDKNTSQDKILKVFAGTENETPMFFINVAAKTIAIAGNDKEHKQKNLIVQCARLIQAWKTREEEEEQEKKKFRQLDDDAELLLNYLKMKMKIYVKSDLYGIIQLQEPDLREINDRYQGGSFPKLVQRMLDLFTVLRDNDESGMPETIARLVKIKAKDLEYFAHRDSLIPALDTRRRNIAINIKERYLDRWSRALRAGKATPPMRFDEFFEKDVLKVLQNEYPDFIDSLASPMVVYNVFFYKQNDPEQFKLIDSFFIKRTEPVFWPYHRLLDLKRNEIYNAAYANLPLTMRLPFISWLIRIWQWITGTGSHLPADEAVLHKKESSKSIEPEDTLEDTLEDNQPFNNEEWLNGLRAAEAKIAGLGNGSKALDKLEENWNLKIGPARKEAREFVEREAGKRAVKIFQMMKKVHPFLPTQLIENLENSATNLAASLKEVHNREALKEFIVLSQIKSLENLVKKAK